MYGIGVDIITVDRIKKSVEKQSFVDKVFGKREQAAFCLDTLKIQSLAANYCAKEAFSKALGTGVRGFDLYEVEILRDEIGKPYFVFSGKAQEIMLSRGLSCNVSLSHEGGNAIAFVVIEQGVIPTAKPV